MQASVILEENKVVEEVKPEVLINVPSKNSIFSKMSKKLSEAVRKSQASLNKNDALHIQEGDVTSVQDQMSNITESIEKTLEELMDP